MTPPVARVASRGFFVTGTDTGVGKTLACCALLRGFAARGKSVIGMKPVAAGAVRGAQGSINADVTQLRAASNVDMPLALVNPYCFEPPIAPHIAAAQAGIAIDLNCIVRAFNQLAAAADVVVVEGAGGFCVPLNRSEDSADLVEHLGLPVILVVGVRLGCLNHALLTAQAIRARNLELAGWIANRIDPTMAVAKQNITALAERLAAPLLGEMDFAVVPDIQRMSEALDLSRL